MARKQDGQQRLEQLCGKTEHLVVHGLRLRFVERPSVRVLRNHYCAVLHGLTQLDLEQLRAAQVVSDFSVTYTDLELTVIALNPTLRHFDAVAEGRVATLELDELALLTLKGASPQLVPGMDTPVTLVNGNTVLASRYRQSLERLGWLGYAYKPEGKGKPYFYRSPQERREDAATRDLRQAEYMLRQQLLSEIAAFGLPLRTDGVGVTIPVATLHALARRAGVPQLVMQGDQHHEATSHHAARRDLQNDHPPR